MKFFTTARRRRPLPPFILALVCCLGCVEPAALENASAETHSKGAASFEGFSIFKNAEENKLQKEQFLEAELVDSLKQLAGVEDARVHLSLADNSILSQTPAEHPQAAVLIIENSKKAPTKKAIQDFVAAAIFGLKAQDVHVFSSPLPHKPEPIVTIGLFRVSAESAPALKLTLCVLLLLCGISASGLIAAGIKIRKMRRANRL